ncbi:MAG: M28 family peptidase [Gemmatimonadaceae bacterium]|nr:M28 family peptidase [Gemmatimonadaceae bacterium]
MQQCSTKLSIPLCRLQTSMLLAYLTLGAAPQALRAQATMLGYAPATATSQRLLEQRFRAGVSAPSLSALHLPLSQRPHPAGSPGSDEVVQYLTRSLRSFGLDVETFEYRVWLSHPRRVRVTLTAPTVRAISVREPALSEDPTSSHPELRESFVAYSASGDVESEMVYVNYGLPADYEVLVRLGVSAKGRIAIARYGRSHRAVKVYAAQQAGARALILYSDPADDGFARGPVWPTGYWRGDQMPQRGNAKLSWYFHGDPLTPGVAALPDAPRLAPASAPTLPRIPVVALGWGEAQHLLSALGGPVAPGSFTGAMPITYRVGPGGSARVEVDLDDGLRPIRNVVAKLRGAEYPDRMVMLGTHHDAWTFGGVDPGTGGAALLETARVLGEMARRGWRPSRTIAFAFWDAEEYGLIGSTEYAEQWRALLQEQLVLYVNTDMYLRGRFDPGGVPSLRDFVVDVARAVPAGNGTVYDGWRASEWERLPTAQREIDAEAFVPDLKALGSGADFVPFQDHLGVPTLSAEFIGVNGYGFGTYHSNFDSRAYVERIADPGFAQGVIMARVLGTLALRMANADVLPFRYSHYARRLGAALVAAQQWGQGIDARAVVPLDMAPLQTRARSAMQLATRLEAAIDRRLTSSHFPRLVASGLNDRLARLEQVLADDDGAAESRWYRHVFYGWNIYSLYDGQPFPGLAEAVRMREGGRVRHEVGRVARALERMSTELAAAVAVAERGYDD